jgi:DNA-binding beta-propeller fold protein YncE
VLLDDKERRIYVASASGRMVVLDPDIGQVVGYVPTGKGDSGIAAQFLPNRLVRLFVPSGDGQLTVVQNIKLNAYVEGTLPAAGIQPTAVAADVKTGKAYVAGPSGVLVLTRGAASQNVVINK